MVLSDSHFIRIAGIVSEAGTCERLKVGAVLVYARRIISIGYNGAPAGMPHCYHREDDDRPCERAVHAEVNAIAFAAKHGVPTKGSTLYTTDSPCLNCARLIINAGIEEVIYGREYRDARGVGELALVGIEVRGPYQPGVPGLQASGGDQPSLHPGEYAYTQAEGGGPTGKGPTNW